MWEGSFTVPQWFVGLMPYSVHPSFKEPMEVKFALIFLASIGVVYQLLSSFASVYEYHVLHRQERQTKKVYKKAKRMLTHYLLFTAAAVALLFAPHTFAREHPRILYLIVGLLFGYQVVSEDQKRRTERDGRKCRAMEG